MLSDDAGNVISGTSQGTLTKVDNTISEAGLLENGQLMLVNLGNIIPTPNALWIDKGSNVIDNDGTLQSTGSSGLIDVDNSGLIWAHGGNISLYGSVTGSGSVLADDTKTVEFGGFTAFFL